MGKHIKKSLVSVLILGVFLSATFLSYAAHHNTETLTNKVHAMYAAMRAGDFEQAFGNINADSNGYVADGFLREIPSEEVKQTVIKMYESYYENGLRINTVPRNIQVKEFGNTAITTFYVDGNIIFDGETEDVMQRGSFVWLNEDDEWKIIHWHISALEENE